MRRFWLPATIVLLAAAGLVAALVERPGDRSLATDVFLLFLGGLALGLIVRETATADRLGPSPLELAQRTTATSDGQVPELERLERMVSMSRQTVFDLHYRLRPVLREIARHRLARRGVDLDAPGSAAELLLGPEAWGLVRPDLPRPSRHFKAGVELESLARAVAALEQL